MPQILKFVEKQRRGSVAMLQEELKIQSTRDAGSVISNESKEQKVFFDGQGGYEVVLEGEGVIQEGSLNAALPPRQPKFVRKARTRRTSGVSLDATTDRSEMTEHSDSFIEEVAGSELREDGTDGQGIDEGHDSLLDTLKEAPEGEEETLEGEGGRQHIVEHHILLDAEMDEKKEDE